MLVKFHDRVSAHREDSGVALIVVVLLMMALMVGAVVVAALVTTTMTGAVNSRSTTQSRAAADAGIAAAVAQAESAANFCPSASAYVSATLATNVTYQVSTDCSVSNQVTFTSTGIGPGNAQTKTQAVYSMTTTTVNTSSADILLYSGTTGNNNSFLAQDVLTGTTGLANVVIPNGSLKCQGHMHANVSISSDFTGTSSCVVDGNLTTGGNYSTNSSTGTVVGGALTAVGTVSSTAATGFGGNIWAGGKVSLAGSSATTLVQVNGNIRSSGAAPALSNAKITGSLTNPNTYVAPGGVTIVGGITKAAVTPPVWTPPATTWIEYSYKPADWAGYTVVTAPASACSSQKKWVGFSALTSYTTPTVIDASACVNGVSSQSAAGTYALKTDIVFIAPMYNLNDVTFTSSSSTAHKIWFITSDADTTDGKPTCASSSGSMDLNGIVITAPISAEAYTPCTLDVSSASTWIGALIGDNYTQGGGLTFTAAPIGLPTTSGGGGGGGGSTTTYALGTKTSQRDIP